MTLAHIVDLQHTGPGNTAQLELEDPLDTGLPDLAVQLVGLGVLRLGIEIGVRLFLLRSSDRSHVTQKVRGEAPVGIAADCSLLHTDAGKLVRTLPEKHHELGVDVDRNRNPVERPVAGISDLSGDRRHLARPAGAADRQSEPAEDLESLLFIKGLENPAVEGHDLYDLVVDKDTTVAIKDPAPRRLLVHRFKHIRDSFVAQLLVLDPLEEPQPGNERTEEDQGHEREDPESQLQLVVVHGHRLNRGDHRTVRSTESG